MTGFGITDRGLVRSENQDCFAIRTSPDGKAIAAVVCDGMGGARAGDTASTLAAERFIHELGNFYSIRLTEMDEILRAAVSKSNTAVFEKAQSNVQYDGMGTTLVAAVVTDRHAYLVNVGDSRAYHVGGGAITKITRDHSVVEDMLLMGEITPEQAMNHPSRNLITKAIGTEQYISGDVFECSIEQGDKILLCSDGLTNLLSEKDLFANINDGSDLKDICTSLVKMAIDRGAPDNVTVVLINNELG